MANVANNTQQTFYKTCDKQQPHRVTQCEKSKGPLSACGEQHYDRKQRPWQRIRHDLVTKQWEAKVGRLGYPLLELGRDTREDRGIQFRISCFILLWRVQDLEIMVVFFFLKMTSIPILWGFPGGLNGQECRRHVFDSWVEMIPWRRKWQPTPVFLPGKSHGQRSLVGYSPWGRERVRHDLVTKEQHPS